MTEPDGYEEDQAVPVLDELQQWEPDAAVLDVDVKGPVQVHPLPARVAVMHTVQVGTTATQIFGRDLRRSRALLWATAATIVHVHVGTLQAEVQAETSAWLIASDLTIMPMVLDLRHCEAVWAKAHTDTADISYVLEQWAD